MSVALSSDGRFLASASLDKTVRLWDIASGRTLHRLDGHTNHVISVALSPDGKFVASGSDDKTARIWDVDSGREVQRFDGRAVSFTPDGKLLISGSDGSARLWDVVSGRALQHFEGLTSTTVTFNPDGKILASASPNRLVSLWDVASGREIPRFKQYYNTPIRAVAFSPDGKFIALGSLDSTLSLWDVASARLLQRFEGHTGSISAVAFSPDGTTFASGSSDKTVYLWDLASGRLLQRLDGNSVEVGPLAFSADGKLLVSGSNHDQLVHIWDMTSGLLQRRFYPQKQKPFGGSPQSVSAVGFNPDGKSLVSALCGSLVCLWDVNTGKEIERLTLEHAGVVRSAFGASGKLFGYGSGYAVRISGVASGRALQRLDGHTSAVVSIGFSRDDKMVASGSFDKTVRIWSVASGQLIRQFEGYTQSISSVVFSPNGNLLASGSANMVRLLDVRSGHELQRFDGNTYSDASVAFSPDGRFLASGTINRRVNLWDVASGHLSQYFEGHSKSVTSVAFNRNGNLFASGSDDGSILLWTSRDPTSVARIFRGTRVNWLGISPEGRLFRHDDGRLLYRALPDGALEPVPPPKPDRPPEFRLTAHDITNPGDGPDRDPRGQFDRHVLAHLTLRVTNTAPDKASRAYWLRAEAVERPPGLVVVFPPTRLRLDAGQTIELPLELSWTSPDDPPIRHRTTALRLKIVHAYGESAPIDVPLRLRAPVLAVDGAPRIGAGLVAFNLMNIGDQATGPVRIRAIFQVAGQEEPAAELTFDDFVPRK
jgi:WD40 repeat protein